MKELKFLYESVVQKQVEEPVIEKREENGQTIEIKRTVKKLQPIKIAVLKPDRRLFKAADIFYSKTLADYLKAGLLPYSLVAKRYANDGGPLSESDKNRLLALKNEATKLEQDFFALSGNNSDTVQKEKNEILVKINSINAEVGTIQSAYSDIFDSTAEVKARQDTMEWWAFYLSYINENNKEFTGLFGDGDYEARSRKLDEIEDEANPFYVEVVKRMSYLVSFWFTARNVVTQIDFKAMEKLYLETASDYKPVADVTPEITITETSPQNVPVPTTT